ncbi:hypothetical protein FKM82_030302 [Ascaphus truei]
MSRGRSVGCGFDRSARWHLSIPSLSCGESGHIWASHRATNSSQSPTVSGTPRRRTLLRRSRFSTSSCLSFNSLVCACRSAVFFVLRRPTLALASTFTSSSCVLAPRLPTSFPRALISACNMDFKSVYSLSKSQRLTGRRP